MIDFEDFDYIREVKGFPRYWVTRDGKVVSCVQRTPLILTPVIRHGYCEVALPHSIQKVHRLVAKAFIPNPEGKPHINHINAIRHDNRVENLEWCTHQENVAHHWRNRDSGDALSRKQVRVIKHLLKWKGLTQREIADIFGCTQSNVSQINKGKIWRDE